MRADQQNPLMIQIQIAGHVVQRHRLIRDIEKYTVQANRSFTDDIKGTQIDIAHAGGSALECLRQSLPAANDFNPRLEPIPQQRGAHPHGCENRLSRASFRR